MSQDLEKRVVDLEKRVAELEKRIASGAQIQDREYIVAHKNVGDVNHYFKTSKDRVLASYGGCYPSYKNYADKLKSILINIGKEDLLKGNSEEDNKKCANTLFGKYGKDGYALFDNGLIINASGIIYSTTPSSKNIKF